MYYCEHRASCVINSLSPATIELPTSESLVGYRMVNLQISIFTSTETLKVNLVRGLLINSMTLITQAINIFNSLLVFPPSYNLRIYQLHFFKSK